MREFYQKVQNHLQQGECVAVATIVRTRGSVPREVGTKMLVHPTGQHWGTVGGGCGEGDVIQAGLRVLDTGQPTLVHVDLTDDVSLESLGVCGGVMDVFVEPWDAARGEVLSALLAAGEAGRPVALVTVVEATGTLAARIGQSILLDEEAVERRLDLGALGETALAQAREALDQGRSQVVQVAAPDGSASLWVEVQTRPARLVIVGAGHIAAPLARLGKLLDFHVTVIDDRPAFANRARFPDADDIVVDYFEPALRRLAVDRQTYLVLVTRGHQHDVDSLLAVLDRPTAYIGMIGSARRIRGVFALLEREMGIDPARLDRVYSPVGLDIGAETPAEIAVSIMAEIVKVRRGGTGVSLTDRERRGPIHAERYTRGRAT